MIIITIKPLCDHLYQRYPPPTGNQLSKNQIKKPSIEKRSIDNLL